MHETILEYEALVRLVAFVGIFAAMVRWEVAAPRRRRELGRGLRWTGNLGIASINAMLLRATFPALAVGLAMMAEERGWGLCNAIGVPRWVAFVASLLVLDLTIYLQHVMFHAVPALWRLHRMHHADLEFDVTTGVRFHPLEIILSMGLKLGLILAFGPPAVAVLVFEVLLNATSMFNHGNVRIPGAVDRVLRWVVVTPDMHWVHHSIHPSETNSNFGFNVPWWDRLLGTYRAQPVDGHETMAIGIEQFRTERDLRLDRMLLQPLRGPAGGDATVHRKNGARDPRRRVGREEQDRFRNVRRPANTAERVEGVEARQRRFHLFVTEERPVDRSFDHRGRDGIDAAAVRCGASSSARLRTSACTPAFAAE